MAKLHNDSRARVSRPFVQRFLTIDRQFGPQVFLDPAMRSPHLLAALAVLATLSSAMVAQAATLSAPIDQGVRISLPPGARDVLIGNAAIADVTVVDSRTAILQGRAYGLTNLVVIDARGRTLLDSQVVVTAPETNRVSVYRGPGVGGGPPQVSNYSCAGRCERTPMPGETETEYNRYAIGFTSYATRAADARRAAAGAPTAP